MAAIKTSTTRRVPGRDVPQTSHVSELIAYFNEYESTVGIKSLHREGIPLRRKGKKRNLVRWSLSDGNTRAPSGIVDDPEDDPADIEAVQERRPRRRKPGAINPETRGRADAHESVCEDINDGLTARPRGGSQVASDPTHYDKLAQIVPYLTAGKRVYRTLLWMAEHGQGLYVTVLWRLYGPHWWGKHTTFGQLAPLVAYTWAAEGAREEMAFERSVDREADTATATQTMHAIKRDDIEIAFWMMAGTMNAAEQTGAKAIATMAAAHGRGAVLARVDIETATAKRAYATKRGLDVQSKKIASAGRRREKAQRTIAATREFMRGLLDAYAYDGVLRARLGAITAADLETDADGAIEWKLRAPPPNLTNEEKVAWTSAREHFKSTVHVQADHLRRDAHEAYRVARSLVVPKSDRTRHLPPPYERNADEIVKHAVSGSSP